MERGSVVEQRAGASARDRPEQRDRPGIGGAHGARVVEQQQRIGAELEYRAKRMATVVVQHERRDLLGDALEQPGQLFMARIEPRSAELDHAQHAGGREDRRGAHGLDVGREARVRASRPGRRELHLHERRARRGRGARNAGADLGVRADAKGQLPAQLDERLARGPGGLGGRPRDVLQLVGPGRDSP